jgi:hypothetical protein
MRIYIRLAAVALLSSFIGEGAMTHSYYTRSPFAGDSGTRSYGRETVDMIHFNGCLMLNGTQVSTYAKVNGGLHAKDATIENVEVSGAATLQQCLVKRSASIYGVFSGDHNTFQGDLLVASERVIVRASNAKNMCIGVVPSFKGIQVVELCQGTKVTGTITFQAGQGTVVVDATSQFTGTVVDGVVSNIT